MKHNGLEAGDKYGVARQGGRKQNKNKKIHSAT